MPKIGFLPPFEPTQDLRNTIRLGCLRWLHSTDFDPSSKSFGIADREYWSWKTKDFSNATWQGGLAGFLDGCDQLNISTENRIKIVRANINGLKLLQKRDGSFEEAYPLESSACVTALVLFNTLYTYFIYPQYFGSILRKELEKLTKTSLYFLEKTPETHGIIANHIATIVFAKRLARRFLGFRDNNTELEDFLSLQHLKEGWFPEYGGPDSGYQTLLNHYVLAGAYALNELPLIAFYMEQSLKFVSLFCFPDGTFGGEIGNRGTSIAYPSGFLALSDEKNSFKGSIATEWFLMQHQSILESVTPITVDGPNFVPVFNSWAFFTKIYNANINSFNKIENNDKLQSYVFLKDAGLLFKKTKVAYIALSLRNGSIRKGIQTDSLNWKDESLAALTFKGWTTQGVSVDKIEHNDKYLSWRFCKVKRKQVFNSPLKLIILRAFALLFFPFPWLQRALKKRLATFVMKPYQAKITDLIAQVDLADPLLTYKIINESQENWEPTSFGFHQHMASANTFTTRVFS